MKQEQAFYLWPLAEQVALHAVQVCADASGGEHGGLTQFEVFTPGEGARVFVLSVKQKGMYGVTFEVKREWVYQIWPGADGQGKRCSTLSVSRYYVTA